MVFKMVGFSKLNKLNPKYYLLLCKMLLYKILQIIFCCIFEIVRLRRTAGEAREPDGFQNGWVLET